MGRSIALVGAGLLAVDLTALAWRSANPSGQLHADVWNFWLPKAKTFMPMLARLIGSSLADEPLALLYALVGVCSALWLLDRDWRMAALGSVFLVAGTLTKNEGLMLSFALALVVALVARRRPVVPLLIAGGPLLAFLAWKGWLSQHGVPPNYAYSSTISSAPAIWPGASTDSSTEPSSS